MGITAVIRIIANTSAITSTQSNPPIELKNNPSNLQQNYLSHLLDVSIDNPVDREVLTYNANTGKYDLTPVTVSSIDGGTF